MSESNQLARVESSALQSGQSDAYGIAEIKHQQTLINQLLKSAMIDGTHYGVIPGCGDKKALLKPGAEKIGVLFRLAPYFEVSKRELPNEHCELIVTCTLKNIVSGQTWGQGLGAATSMENKYRYQTKSTGRTVPEEYWQTRDKDLLGGAHCIAKKINGVYVVMETQETENPMDKVNTYVKIAAKRAHVAAILLCTAASDIFVNDDELADAHDNDGTLPTDAEASQSKTRQAAPNQTAKPAPAPAATKFEGDWANVVAHWGNVKGTRLGDLPRNKLWFYAEKWEPQRDSAGKIKNPQDAAMKAAAVAGFAEMEKAEKEQAGERDEPPMN